MYEMGGVFEPRAEHIVDFLNGKEEEKFRTSDIRMKLATYSAYNTPTAPVNKMLVDLSEEGYIKPVNYDLSNHEWEVVDGSPSSKEIESVLETYLEGPLTPDKFYSSAE